MFYKVVDSKSKTDLWIKWNTGAICMGQSGFIIQHVSIKSHIDSVRDNDYWESWEITDGRIHQEDIKFDDEWSPIPDVFIPCCREEIEKSPDGIISYSSCVYFVPIDSVVHEEISKWMVDRNSPANELPMTYNFKTNVDDYYICSREYVWHYKELLQEYNLD